MSPNMYDDEDSFYSEENLATIEGAEGAIGGVSEELAEGSSGTSSVGVSMADLGVNLGSGGNQVEVGTLGGNSGDNGGIGVSTEGAEDEDGIVDEASMAMTQTVSLSELGISLDELEVEDTNDTVFSAEERLRTFSDNIISNCFGEREISRYALDKLFTLSNPNMFRDENFILFSVLYQFRSKMKDIKIDEEFIRLFLNRNRQIIQNARGNIDISAYGEVDGSVELGYIGGVLKHYRRLLTLPDLSKVDFNTNFEKYIIEYKAMEASKVYNQSKQILSEGLKIGRKLYSGFEDSQNFVRRRLAELDGIDKAESGTGFTTAREMLMKEETTKKSEKISDFDKLEALNKIYGGVYTGMFYQIIAPPKAGKTKFCERLVHTTAIKYGNNVSVWAAEGGKEAFLAEIRAIHFDHTYNNGVSITEKKFGINQDVILHDKYPSEELKQLELSSKLDLASNRSYGEIDFIDRPFNVETFIMDIDTSVKSNNSKLLVIDYLQLMGSERNLSERERVAEAYRELLVYCRNNNIAVISPGQYKQDTFEQLLAKGNTLDADLRTAGGTSAEVLRTPDIIFAFWATTQDLLNNSMKIVSMPCRFSKPHPEINVLLDLSVSQFISV